MYRVLLLLLIIVPAIEIYFLIQVGHWIGGLQTLLFILFTAFLGAYLARKEAAKVWREAGRQMQNGQIPGRAVIDGLCIFAGGLLLLTPGFVTDVIGLMLIFPLTRPVFRWMILRYLKQRMERGDIRILR